MVYTGYRGWWAVRRDLGGFFFTLEKAKISNFFKLENFQNMLKNQRNFYNFFQNLQENLAIFENFLTFHRNFRENLGKNLEYFGNVDW